MTTKSAKPPRMQPFLPGILQRGVAELRRVLEGGNGVALEPALVERLDAVLGKEAPGEIRVRLQCTGCGRAFEGRTQPLRAAPSNVAAAITKVLPRVPVRHWVLSLPRRLRALAGEHDELGPAYARAFVRSIFAWQRRAAGRGRGADVQCGAVSVVQRGGSALNLDVHVHAIVLDGVYLFSEGGAVPEFHRLPDPSGEDLAWVTARARARIEHLARRHRDQGGRGKLQRLREASTEHRVSSGAHAGTAVKRATTASSPRPEPTGQGRTHARAGYSVHAASRLAREDRRAIASLAGYLTRPPLQAASIRVGGDGALRYRLKNSQRDGATHVELRPEELVEKLVAMLPSGPGRRLAYHGVLAPAAAKRHRVVPGQLDLFPRPRRRRRKRASGGNGRAGDARCPECGATLQLLELEEASAWVLRA